MHRDRGISEGRRCTATPLISPIGTTTIRAYLLGGWRGRHHVLRAQLCTAFSACRIEHARPSATTVSHQGRSPARLPSWCRPEPSPAAPTFDRTPGVPVGRGSRLKSGDINVINRRLKSLERLSQKCGAWSAAHSTRSRAPCQKPTSPPAPFILM